MMNEFTREINDHYCSESDMTFVTETISHGIDLVSTSVIGFYFGSPEDRTTEYFGNGDKKNLKAVFDKENDETWVNLTKN